MPKHNKTAHVAEKSMMTQAVSGVDIKKSYKSLLYGVLTLLVVFAIFIGGIKMFSFKGKGEISKEAANTENVTAVTDNSPNEMQSLETYTVQQGDNLWKISEKIYNTGYNWTLIAEINKISNPDVITEGTKLTLPKLEQKVIKISSGKSVGTEIPPTQIKNKITDGSYTVQKGDFLWEIAVRAYGDGFQWSKIAQANNITNPDLVFSGTVLKLPR